MTKLVQKVHNLSLLGWENTHMEPFLYSIDFSKLRALIFFEIDVSDISMLFECLMKTNTNTNETSMIFPKNLKYLAFSDIRYKNIKKIYGIQLIGKIT